MADFTKKGQPRKRKRSRHKRLRFDQHLDRDAEKAKPFKFPLKIYTRPPINRSRQKWLKLWEDEPVRMKDKYGNIKTGFPKFRKLEERFEAELLFYKHPFSPVRFTNVPKERIYDLMGADPKNPTVYQSLSEALCAVKERKTAKPDSEWRVIDDQKNEIMLHQVQNQLDRLSVDSLESMKKWNIQKFTKSRKQIWPTCIKELNDIVLGIKADPLENERKKRNKKSNHGPPPNLVCDDIKALVAKAVSQAMRERHKQTLVCGLPAILPL